MPNPDHADIILKGDNKKAVQQWREQHKRERFDCSDLTIEGRDLSGWDLSFVDFSKARFISVNLKGATCVNTNFENAHFKGVSFEDCNMPLVNMMKASCTPRSGFSLIHANMYDAKLQGAVFVDADFTRAILTKANLQGATLQHSDFSKSRMGECEIAGTDFANAWGLATAINLETVRAGRDETRERYFDTVDIPWLERYLSWERIRWLGRLPLFAASYSALIAIPFLFYFLDFYNRQATAALKWAATASKSENPPPAATFVLEHLRLEGIPDQSLAILLAAVLLAIGSTIFVLLCPSRIREFSRDQWTDEFRRSLVLYWALSWKNRTARILCVLFYSVGGALAVYVLITKVIKVAIFIWQNWHVGQ